MLFQKGNKIGIGNRFKKDHKLWLGKHPSDETRRKMSEAHKGRSSWTKGKHLSEEHKRKLSEIGKKRHPLISNETRKKMSEKVLTGEKNPSWKGGISKDKKHTNELAKRIGHKRRTLKKGADGSFTLAEWELLKKQYGYTCPICNEKEPKIKLTIDHIIPISKGGSNFIENIQPLCGSCNSRKCQKAFKINKKGQFELIFNKVVIMGILFILMVIKTRIFE